MNRSINILSVMFLIVLPSLGASSDVIRRLHKLDSDIFRCLVENGDLASAESLILQVVALRKDLPDEQTLLDQDDYFWSFGLAQLRLFYINLERGMDVPARHHINSAISISEELGRFRLPGLTEREKAILIIEAWIHHDGRRLITIDFVLIDKFVQSLANDQRADK